MSKYTAEVGQRFGSAVVLKPDDGKDKYGMRAARLVCDCGNEFTCALSRLYKGYRKSCGCLKGQRGGRKIDLAGQKIGMLTVLSQAPSRSGNRRWLCECECGTVKEVSAAGLNATLKGRPSGTRSCGCIRSNPRPWHGRGRTPYEAARLKVLRAYISSSARKRDIEWALTDDEFFKLVEQDCHYCGAEPSMSTTSRPAHGEPAEYLHNGIDREDNTRGYVPGNVLPCCSVCNHAKKDMTYAEFILWVAQLTQHRRVRWIHRRIA